MGYISLNCDAHVNKEIVDRFADTTALSGSLGYGYRVPRTDENGRQLKALLDYLLDGEVDAKDIYEALGISSSTYYRRIKEADYPDAEELRRVADRFGLSYPDLQIRFGLMSRQEVWNYIESTPMGVTAVREAVKDETKTRRKRQKLSELKPRSDAPPL
ncbi:hypothetical protein MHAS_02098 [Mycolicibacterium hassiacum DSM 44199]|jgi:hypothetical protein|nr:hypothetical protein MHAS_02098 [Mycolicibacterium hassiacum DSM 44199]